MYSLTLHPHLDPIFIDTALPFLVTSNRTQ